MANGFGLFILTNSYATLSDAMRCLSIGSMLSTWWWTSPAIDNDRLYGSKQ